MYKQVNQASVHGESNSIHNSEDEENTLNSEALGLRLNSDTSSYVSDVFDLFKLSSPIAISSLAWVGMKATDTALIGHTNTVFLSASAVADLWMQSTGVFLSGGILSMLASQSVGSNNKFMAGIWAQVSLFVLALIAIPVIVSYICTGQILCLFGTSDILIGPASYYAQVLAAAVPARIMMSQLSQYFMAQRITEPLVVCGLLALIFNLFFGIILVHGAFGISGFGFYACPIVTSLVEWIQLLFMLYWYCHRHGLHLECWPGINKTWLEIHLI